MALSTPEGSLGMGVAVGVVAYSVFQAHLPPVVDVRTVDSCNRDVHASVKSATWQAAGATAAIALIAKDATVFILGGVVTLALAWSYHHANAVSPLTGKASGTMTADDIVWSQQESLPHQVALYDTVI
jgi:hypothetical protein